MRCLFLISDEGYGHTVRQSCIANELANRGVDVIFQCRDPVPFAAKILDKRIKIYEYFNLIRLVKQKGGVDVELTYNEFFQNYITISNEWIMNMAGSQHALDADIIVTDIVEEAGVLSKKLNKPVVAISHFTWHWLLRELGPMFWGISQYLEQCLDGVSEFLYTPFSINPEQFPNSKPINLIARKPRKREEVRKELKIKDDDIVILLAGGGTSVWENLFSSINISKKKRFVFLADLHAPSNNIKCVPNLFRLHDYINASDLVVSRGGYGTISETLAYGIRHLILIEKNHPEATENAKLLTAANRAIMRNLKDFLSAPHDLIDDTLNAKFDLSPMKSDGHIQAVSRLFEIWEECCLSKC